MSSIQLRQERTIALGMLEGARARLRERIEAHGLPPEAASWVEGGPSPANFWLAVRGVLRPGARLDESRIPAEARADLYLSRLEIDTYRKRVALLEVELHKKYALAFACFVFVLVGAPLGVRVRRGGLTVGFLSLAFFLLYYILLVVGEGLAERLLLSPLLAMWLPDLLLGAIGAVWTAAACDVRLLPRRRPAAPIRSVPSPAMASLEPSG
jgi:hypothetical protein